MNRDQALAESIAACFRKHLQDEYVPRIRKCVDLLSREQAWTKPSKHGNSVVNLLLHLTGNTTQWILCGLGGVENRRDRDGEFAAGPESEKRSLSEIMVRLEATVADACDVVDGLSVDVLLADREFQGGRYRGNGLSGVLHVLEHFSGHAGQIYTQTKQLSEADLGFYAHLSTGAKKDE